MYYLLKLLQFFFVNRSTTLNLKNRRKKYFFANQFTVINIRTLNKLFCKLKF